MKSIKNHNSYAEFYPFYLDQHKNKVCRILHYIGSSLALLLLIYSCINLSSTFLVLGLVVGYAFAWVGHFFFEKNMPATFKNPIFSLMGDWNMLFDAIMKKRL